ncbi:ATP-dependent helicase HrpB [Fimbriiglobus ruber]|uniref:ATP-dependent helicase HrpB n=1 Tax=Fimbriiglobus ruber TaxID=1908690 RepID=A0A225E7J5_9BACT|nr:ATP-dependent helicase HrpB [Fimbriiglobus ruber]OWK44407.1 ATP-dependent helicase HrpB [Fimbriiglobus ruber]
MDTANLGTRFAARYQSDMARDRLPIDDVIPDLLNALKQSGAVVLRAPTGAGKTTRVPPAIVESGLAGAGQVLLLEPRRVAARAAARRMAVEHGSALGDVYGYHVRFDRKAGPRTRAVAVTPGILLRMLHDDPFLERISAVVFDEFHERGLEADLALGMVRLVRQTVRPDLQVVVMSATIDADPVAAYLGDCRVVTSEGRTFPVDIRYRPRRPEAPWPVATAAAVRTVLDETDGDALVFLPGLREIRQTTAELEGFARDQNIALLPLHGDLPPEQQDRALQKLDRRKIVLATNVAETSVTVDGVTVVVDTGLARVMEFDAGVGMDRLRLVPIARASADQRAGRAGRTRPGVCVRLWDEPGHRSRPEQTEPEIRRVDLAGAVLQLLALGETAVEAFPWLEPPRPEAVAQALGLLRRLDALDGNTLTDTGRTLARLPVHPRVGRLLVEGQRLGIPDRAALAGAILSERDSFERGVDAGPPRAPAPTVSDVLDRVEALEAFDSSGRLDGPLGRLHRGGAWSVLQARDQLRRLVRDETTTGTVSCSNPDNDLLRAILAAFPDRLARRRGPNDRRAKMVGGRGVRLGPSSGVVESDLFVCVDVDAGGVESLVRLASSVEREWLPAEKLVVANEILFDGQAGKLVARKQTRYEDLVIDDTAGHIGDETRAAQVLAAAAAARLDQVLPPADSDAGRFRVRVRCLRGWMPALELPAFDDTDLGELLEPFCRGRRSLADLRNGPWLDALRRMLSYQKLQAVDREAPDSIEVPSGSHITMQYEEGRPPILAARIQELFGLTETPRVAGGRVKVLLHLLAPNYRPQQVTDDLASFWKNGYPLVRKELRARYPRHSWPDDPFTAEAIRGPRRRSE